MFRNCSIPCLLYTKASAKDAAKLALRACPHIAQSISTKPLRRHSRQATLYGHSAVSSLYCSVAPSVAYCPQTHAQSAVVASQSLLLAAISPAVAAPIRTQSHQPPRRNSHASLKTASARHNPKLDVDLPPYGWFLIFSRQKAQRLTHAPPFTD